MGNFRILRVLITLSFSIRAANAVRCLADESVVVPEEELSNKTTAGREGIHHRTDGHSIDNAEDTTVDCICEKRACLRKCCGEGLLYKIVNNSKTICVPGSGAFEPVVRVNGTNVTASALNFLYIYETLECPESFLRTYADYYGGEFYLRTDGSLYIEVPHMNSSKIKDIDSYCLDIVVEEENGFVTDPRLSAIVCEGIDQPHNNINLNIICMPISCFFILLTVAVYMLVPELLNLHGLVLMAYLLCLFVGFSFLIFSNSVLNFESVKDMIYLIFTILIYYSLLAAFCWLNVMCFDIWITFSGRRGRLEGRPKKWKRFFKYSQYAFGTPMALTALLLILEFSGIEGSYMPQIRKNNFFSTGTAELVYFYGPVIILSFANIVFFSLTILQIANINRQTRILVNEAFNGHRSDKERFFLYVKLFVTMGINWLLELASALYPDAKEIWKYTDIYNIFIGLTIFFTFVCNKRTLKLIKRRYFRNANSSFPTQSTLTKMTVTKDNFLLRSTTISSTK